VRQKGVRRGYRELAAGILVMMILCLDLGGEYIYIYIYIYTHM
jgi:hypothetical protein